VRRLGRGEVVVCGPVVAELVAGLKDDQREPLVAALRALSWAALDRARWIDVGVIAGALRRRGTPVPLTDIEIAVIADRAGAEVWTADADFDRIVEVLDGLRVRQLD